MLSRPGHNDFRDGDSRNGDFRVRLATAIAASLAIALTVRHDSLGLVLVAGLTGCGVAIARGETSLHEVLRRLLVVNAFVVLLWLSLPWRVTAGGLTWSPDGVGLATMISLRTNAIAAACLGLLAGMDTLSLARAAAGLGLPPRFTRLLVLTVRYIGLLGATHARMERAGRARGLRRGCNRRTLVVTAQMVALLLVHALIRAERAEMAMRARGFSASVRIVPPWRDQAAQLPWVVAAGAALLVSWALPLRFMP